MASFALPTLQLESVQPLPFPFDATTIRTAPPRSRPPTGTSTSTAPTRDLYVAHAPLADLPTSASAVLDGSDVDDPTDPATRRPPPSAAQPTTWLNSRRSRSSRPTTPDQAPFAEPWVVPYKTGAEAPRRPRSPPARSAATSRCFTAPDPSGPFTLPTPPPVTDAPNSITQLSYGAFSLNPVSANPVIVYSTNVNSLSGQPQPPYSIQESRPAVRRARGPLP